MMSRELCVVGATFAPVSGGFLYRITGSVSFRFQGNVFIAPMMRLDSAGRWCDPGVRAFWRADVRPVTPESPGPGRAR